MINELQRYSQFGKIDVGILSQLQSDVPIEKIVGHIKDKNFGEVRKWAATNDVDSNTLFRKLYDALYEKLKSHSMQF